MRVLLTRGHFRSRDKDGGHTIRSALSENPMLHANLMALRFIKPELYPLDILHCGNRDFRPFCSCDLDLYPMTITYKVDRYFLEIYQIYENELRAWSRLFCKLPFDRQTKRQTRRKLYITPRRGWSNLVQFLIHSV